MFQSTTDDCEIPSFYVDPVTCEIMVNPHLLPSGHCFDLDTIKLLNPQKCPLTHMPFTMNDIMPNSHLKSLIESKIEFIKQKECITEYELDICTTYIKKHKSYYEKLERERLERERLEQERLERERLERERLERERLERERFERLERRRQEELEHTRRRQEELEQKRLKRIYRLERSESKRLERHKQIEQERLQSKRFKRAQFEQEQHEQLKYEQELYKQVWKLRQEHPDYGRYIYLEDFDYSLDNLQFRLKCLFECERYKDEQIEEWAIDCVLQEQPECKHAKLRLRFEQNKILEPEYVDYHSDGTFTIKPDAALFQTYPDIHQRWKEQQLDRERLERIAQRQERKLRHIAMLERHREEKKQRQLSNSLY